MIERKFPIATTHGNINVKGYASDAESMIGIHHDPDGPTGAPYWTVTFIPVGTKINSLFPEQMRTRGCREILLEFAAKIEDAELPAWLALSGLPWGSSEIPPCYDDALRRIKFAAGLGVPPPPSTEKPLAVTGLFSYRYASPYGFVMIGAKNHGDALAEARRSIDGLAEPTLADLEIWAPVANKYIPAASIPA